MRVILDTNILQSSLIRGDSVPGRILEAWIEDRFILLTDSLQLDELRAVSRRQEIRALIRGSEAGRLVNQIRAERVMTQPEHPCTRAPMAAAFDPAAVSS